PLGVLALARLARPRSRGAGLRLAATLCLATMAVVPVIGGYLAVRAANPDLANQTLWTIPPLPTHLPWRLVTGDSPTAVPVAALAVIVAGWFAATAADRRALWHAALWVAVGVVISLTPVVVFFQTRVSLPPLQLAEMLGVYRAVRIPARLGIAALLGLCLMAGLAFAACTARLRAHAGGVGRGVAIALAALVVGAMYADAALAPARFARRPWPPAYP